MTVNGMVAANSSEFTFNVGDMVNLVCNTTGGNPAETNVTIQCDNEQAITATNSVSKSLTITESNSLQKCRCSYENMSGHPTNPVSITVKLPGELLFDCILNLGHDD